jgi:hypothetical protein
MDRQLFVLFTYPQNRVLSFTQYISGLDKILKRVSEDHLQCMQGGGRREGDRGVGRRKEAGREEGEEEGGIGMRKGGTKGRKEGGRRKRGLR